MKFCMYTYFFLACALSGYILVNHFTSCVTDRYQHKQYIIMEIETETNMKICMYLLVVCATCSYIFVNPFNSCVTFRYLPQQYITMQTINISAHGNYRFNNKLMKIFIN